MMHLLTTSLQQKQIWMCKMSNSSLDLWETSPPPSQWRDDHPPHAWEKRSSLPLGGWILLPRKSLGRMIVSPNRGRIDQVSHWETWWCFPLGDMIISPTIGRDDHTPQRNLWVGRSSLPSVGELIMSPNGRADHVSQWKRWEFIIAFLVDSSPQNICGRDRRLSHEWEKCPHLPMILLLAQFRCIQHSAR